ncbi:MAG: hypothetical protein KDK34_23165 [Leptospiraceae bacterium]|nr:hypothetical protein [Leptospiraceae bacterium]
MSVYLRSARFWILSVAVLTVLPTVHYSRGFVWPDEIYQTVEPAYNWLYGRGILTWEFEEQVRSVLYPALMAPVVGSVYGLTSNPEVLYFTLRLLVGCFYAFALLSLYNLFRRFWYPSAEMNEARSASLIFFLLLVGCMPPALYFGFRTLTESLSTALVIMGLSALYRMSDRNWIIISGSGGFLLGLAYGIRFQTALFTGPFLIAYAIQSDCFRRDARPARRRIYAVSGGMVLALLIYALSDWLYYDIPFISTYRYFEFNIVKDVASQWGRRPFGFYLQTIYQLYGLLPALLALPAIFMFFKKTYPIIAGMFFFWLVHALVGHKEERFIYLLFPLLGLFAAGGLFQIWRYLQTEHKRRVWPVTILLILFTLFGYYRAALRIPWNLNRLNLTAFTATGDVEWTGNALVGTADIFAWSPGYVYLGPDFRYHLSFYELGGSIDRREQETKFIIDNQIKHILMPAEFEPYYCAQFDFCEVQKHIDSLVWMRKKNGAME